MRKNHINMLKHKKKTSINTMLKQLDTYYFLYYRYIKLYILKCFESEVKKHVIDYI